MKLLYAYALIYIGVVFEGELAVIAGALSANNGVLDIRLVGLTAFISTLTTDWILFFTGKHVGAKLIDRFPVLQKRTQKPRKRLKQSPDMILAIYRFLYGFRIVTLLLLGMSQVSSIKFMIYSFVSVLLWTIVYSILGYHLGGVISNTVENFEYLGLYLIAGLLGLSLLVFLSKVTLRKIKMVRIRE